MSLNINNITVSPTQSRGENKTEDTDKDTASMNNDVHCQESSTRPLPLSSLPPSLCELRLHSIRTGRLDFLVLGVLIHLGSPPSARLSPYYKRVSRSAVDWSQREGGDAGTIERRKIKMKKVEQNVLKLPKDIFACEIVPVLSSEIRMW